MCVCERFLKFNIASCLPFGTWMRCQDIHWKKDGSYSEPPPVDAIFVFCIQADLPFEIKSEQILEKKSF